MRQPAGRSALRQAACVPHRLRRTAAGVVDGGCPGPAYRDAMSDPTTRRFSAAGGVDVADRVLGLAAPGLSVHRCVGTAQELSDYRRSLLPEGDPRREGWQPPAWGWSVMGGEPGPGDLLLGVVRPAWVTYTIDVVPAVEAVRTSPVTRGGRPSAGGRAWVVAVDQDADVQLPLLDLERVHARMPRRPASGWRVLRGPLASEFLVALAHVVRESSSAPSHSRTEGEAATSTCRRRNQANRMEAIEAVGGVCQGCHVKFRDWFGDYALDAHHAGPLAEKPTGKVLTPVSDLIVLCPTCHRIVHRNPHWIEPLVALSLQWDRLRQSTTPSSRT